LQGTCRLNHLSPAYLVGSTPPLSALFSCQCIYTALPLLCAIRIVLGELNNTRPAHGHFLARTRSPTKAQRCRQRIPASPAGTYPKRPPWQTRPPQSLLPSSPPPTQPRRLRQLIHPPSSLPTPPSPIPPPTPWSSLLRSRPHPPLLGPREPKSAGKVSRIAKALTKTTQHAPPQADSPGTSQSAGADTTGQCALTTTPQKPHSHRLTISQTDPHGHRGPGPPWVNPPTARHTAEARAMGRRPMGDR